MRETMATPNEALSTKELQPEQAADPQVLGIAQQFLLQYYQIFDTNRAGLAALYVSDYAVQFPYIDHICDDML